MKQKLRNFSTNADGIAHLGLILLIVLVVSAVSFGTYRVIDANKSEQTVELTDEDVENSLDDEENKAQKEDEDNPADVNDEEQEKKNEVN